MTKTSPKEAEGHSRELIEASRAPRKIGNSLDRFIGTWSAEEEAEFLQAIQIFEHVDEPFWQ